MAVAEGEWIRERKPLSGRGRVGAKDDEEVRRRVHFVEVRPAEERGPCIAKADADKGHAPRREVAEHREEQRAPERQVASGLVGTNGRIDSADRQLGPPEPVMRSDGERVRRGQR